MRITEIFALGGGCDYGGCLDYSKGYYKDDYIYGGYPRFFDVCNGGACGAFVYRPPQRLCGSRFI